MGGHTHYRTQATAHPTLPPTGGWKPEQATAIISVPSILGVGNRGFRQLLVASSDEQLQCRAELRVLLHPHTVGRLQFPRRLRANSYLAAGIVPLWNPREGFSLRFNAYVFAPMRTILPSPDHGAMYGPWFDRAEFFGELAANYRLPFANVSGYANYDSSSRNSTSAFHWAST